MNAGLVFDKVQYWIQHYTAGGADDARAVSDFIICENDELLGSLRAQINTIAQGNYDEDVLDKTVGLKRKLRHGSYEAWAKLMLLWILEAKKH